MRLCSSPRCLSTLLLPDPHHRFDASLTPASFLGAVCLTISTAWIRLCPLRCLSDLFLHRPQCSTVYILFLVTNICGAFFPGSLTWWVGRCLINPTQPDRLTVINCRPLGACPCHALHCCSVWSARLPTLWRDWQSLEKIRARPGRYASVPEPPCSGLGQIVLPLSFGHFLTFDPGQGTFILSLDCERAKRAIKNAKDKRERQRHTQSIIRRGPKLPRK